MECSDFMRAQFIMILLCMKQRLSRLWSNISVMTFSVDTSLSLVLLSALISGASVATGCPGPNPLIHKFRITTLLSRDKDPSITCLKPASAQEIFKVKGLPKVERKINVHESYKIFNAILYFT